MHAVAASLATILLGSAAAGCAGIGTSSVTPLPPTAVGLPLYLTPLPEISVSEPDARTFALTLEHAVHDAFEEAGFSLAPSPEAAYGLVAQLAVASISKIHADVFIHGAQACGVSLKVTWGGSVLASAEPESSCIASSTYYGMLPKDAAVAMVDRVSRHAVLDPVVKAWHASAPPAAAASSR